MTATSWAWLVLLFPLLGSIVIGLSFRAIPAKAAGAIGTAAIALAFICGIGALLCLLGESPDARHHASSLWEYASVAGLHIKLGIYVDPLSVFMVLIVTGVSTLIHLYSYGYMQSDEGYHRFFSYLNFFVFSMLLLVLAGNFVLLIVGWAFVGFASYALISFWYRRRTAVRAGIKGYVVKTQASADLVRAINEVLRGMMYLSPGISHAVVEAYLAKSELPPDPLTSREREVLQLVAEGKSTKEIARLLGISFKTAESHRTRIMKKTDIHETAGLVRYAVRRGLIQP